MSQSDETHKLCPKSFHNVVLALIGGGNRNQDIVSVLLLGEEQRRLSPLICAQTASEI